MAIRLLVTFLFSVLYLVSHATHAAGQTSPWQVRVRAVTVAPDEESTITVIGGSAKAQTVVVPELDITFFFSQHIAAELILATTKHKVRAIDTALGDVDLGDVRLLPPTLTLQYHFAPESSIRPYIGGGVNYTLFYDADAPGGVITDISYKDKVGFALQAGVDVALSGNWFLNIDLKKLFLGTNVSINGGAIMADVDLNPWIIGVGFGYRR